MGLLLAGVLAVGNLHVLVDCPDDALVRTTAAGVPHGLLVA